MYAFIKKEKKGTLAAAAADQRHLKAKAFVPNIAGKVEYRPARDCQEICSCPWHITKMVHATLHKDMKLSKKSARWVSKLMDEEMKKEVSQDMRGIRSVGFVVVP